MDTIITNLENNQRANNHQDDKGNIQNQHNQPANNADWDLGIKLVIPEYNEKLKPDEFMDWLVCVKNIFAHKPMTRAIKSPK